MLIRRELEHWVLSWNSNKGEVMSLWCVSTVNTAIQGHTISSPAPALHSSIIFDLISSSRDSETLFYTPQAPCSVLRQGWEPGELPLEAGGECTALVLPFCSAAEHKELFVESGIQRLWGQVVQKAAGLDCVPWCKARPNASVLNCISFGCTCLHSTGTVGITSVWHHNAVTVAECL